MSTTTPPQVSPQAFRDIAAGLAASEARWLVDYYYAVQDYRIQATGQARAVAKQEDEGATNLAEKLGGDMAKIEEEIKRALLAFARKHRPGRWAMSITGIGPVIAAGLLAHIDITRAPTVGHIWSFAGLNPTVKWGKGEKRPWNAKLKVLCWKIGDSFVKQSGRDSDIYGHIYRERKELEVQRNEQGLFADQARESLETRNIKDKELRKTLELGRLPDGRIDLRARRYATKLFLAHLHHVMYVCEYDTDPPMPYIITHSDQHTHFLAPPNWPCD